MTVEISGSCHCGTVRFRVRLSDGLRTARRCDCSMCRMRGAVAVSAPRGGITFVSGEENLALYQFNTRIAEHYFCKTCGIYTHHRRRSNPEELGINVACLDGLSPFDFEEIAVNNGRAHPSDGARPEISGVLRFDRTSGAT